jgi:hypothetical protein
VIGAESAAEAETAIR